MGAYIILQQYRILPAPDRIGPAKNGTAYCGIWINTVNVNETKGFKNINRRRETVALLLDHQL